MAVMDQFHKSHIASYKRDQCKQALLWCMENLNSDKWNWYGADEPHQNEEFIFTDESDLVMFKLMWEYNNG
jgi:hypothetical protein